MAQPVWKTPAGSLGTLAEGTFYQIAVEAEAGPAETVYFRVIAGQLPEGVQLNTNGTMSGIPRPVARVQGVPQTVAADVTSRFAIRAYTLDTGTGRIARLADRTFTITITGQDVPEFVTPPGSLGAYFDGSEVNLSIVTVDPDLSDRVRLSVIAGALPPGLTMSRTGQISGIIRPESELPGVAEPGYDQSPYDQYAFDFTTRSVSRNYQFTVEVTDGKQSNIRTFEIFVYSQDSMTADNAQDTADNTFITADVSTVRTPIMLTPAGDLGTVRADNYFATRFEAVDFDGDAITFELTQGAGIGYDINFVPTAVPTVLPNGMISHRDDAATDAFNNTEGSFDFDGDVFDSGFLSLPPGLSLDPDSGWLHGYIPDQGATEATYQFAVRARKRDRPGIISEYYYYTLTIAGNIDTEVTWLTDPDLGTVDNGAVSTLAVSAVNVGGRQLQYRLAPGTFNRLPQGLTLQPSGHITGRVAFNTFALDSGSTTFDIVAGERLSIDKTTFDLGFRFTVNAYAPTTEELGFAVREIRVNSGGSGYVSQPTVIISAPPATAESIQATAGVVTIENGRITAIAVGNPGRGYIDPPTVTITGGGGSGASVQATLFEVEQENAVSVFRTFELKVNRRYNEPYETLQMRAAPPTEDRALLDSFLNDLDLIPESVVYRSDDPNFGVARGVIYDHAYGLAASDLDLYVESMQRNHSDRAITLGPIRTAQALSVDGEILYEVIYSEIIDDLVNELDVSVSANVFLPYPVTIDSTQIDTVYPPSLSNMRDRVIDTVGRVDQALPLWMTSKQPSGRVLGFTRAWVIAYVKPGESGRVAYDISENLDWDLNIIDFEVDRYVLDQSQTHNWNTVTDTWQPQPPAATAFDRVSTRRYQLPDLGTFGRIARSDTFVADSEVTEFTVPVIGQPRLLVQVDGVTQDPADYQIGYAYDSVSISLTISIDQSSIVTVTVYQILDTYVLDPESAASTRTTFDQDSTRFIQISDRWTSSDQFDKYLIFPKRNILENKTSTAAPVVWTNLDGRAVNWINSQGAPVGWINQD